MLRMPADCQLVYRSCTPSQQQNQHSTVDFLATQAVRSHRMQAVNAASAPLLVPRALGAQEVDVDGAHSSLAVCAVLRLAHECDLQRGSGGVVNVHTAAP